MGTSAQTSTAKPPLSIVAVKTNIQGSIDKYLLSNGIVIDRAEAVRLVQHHSIPGYDVAVDKYGNRSIKTNKASHLKGLKYLPELTPGIH